MAAEDVNGVDIYAYLQNRFKTVTITIGDTPDYAVPAHLLPEALLDAEQENPEEYLEYRTMHRRTIPDIKADKQAPAAGPEAGAAEAEAPASPTEVAFSTNPTYIPIFPQQGIPASLGQSFRIK